MSDSITQKIKSPDELAEAYRKYTIKRRLLGEEKSRINTYINFLRVEQKWELHDIADLIGVTPQGIKSMMKGVRS